MQKAMKLPKGLGKFRCLVSKGEFVCRACRRARELLKVNHTTMKRDANRNFDERKGVVEQQHQGKYFT